MKLPRIVPIIGMSLALVLAAPLAHADTVPETPAPTTTTTTEPAPVPEPETTPPPEPEPSPEPPPVTTPEPEPELSPEPTSSTTSAPQPATTTTTRTTVPSTTTYTSPPSPWTGGARYAPAPPPAPLTAVDISTQLAEADALLASLSAGNAAVAVLIAELQVLTQEANDALEAKSIADEVSRRSTARAATARATAVRLADELERKHQQLRDWAFSAYSDGGSTAEMVSVFDALIKDPSKAGNPVGDLAYLTDERLRLFQDIRSLTKRQQAAADRAQVENEKAREASAEAAVARAAADEALKKHTETVAKAQESQITALQNAAPMAAMLLGLASPEAKRRGEAILAALLANNLDLPDIDRPCSDDAGLHPNGQFPPSALCPLWEAPGEFAVPNAAVAFNAMSKKFAADFGRPICVVDSYRSFTEQVAVKATRGFWAATPGTSNHGFGRALDLCGGINSFGTIEHLWMKQNAPLFGWFHPSWAAATGPKPEPWHWEYAG
ncbi:MAG: D-alanyl-D-alanine carboxypeptidase family protein [Dermatophilaceae bacterium]